VNTVCIRIATLTIMASASAAAQSTVRATLQPALERKPAADFALRDVTGKTAKLQQYRGKVLLLDFWATWCTGCKQEIPWFVEFQRKFGTKRFAVVGVSLDEGGWDVLQPFLAMPRLTCPIGCCWETMRQRSGTEFRTCQTHSSETDRGGWRQLI
jgi:thiol-disulfide isomerase/thioredoxin